MKRILYNAAMFCWTLIIAHVLMKVYGSYSVLCICYLILRRYYTVHEFSTRCQLNFENKLKSKVKEWSNYETRRTRQKVMLNQYQITKQKPKVRTKRQIDGMPQIIYNSGGEIRCPGRASIPCPSCVTRHVSHLVKASDSFSPLNSVQIRFN